MSSNGGLPFRFTDERHMKFVELYSREPCLWNRQPQLWVARNAAYKRIQMGINAEVEPTENPITLQGVKMKIKNLRTGYHQELKKIRANPKYTPKIPWFAPLHKLLAQFLDKKSDEDIVLVNTPPLKRLQIKLPRLKTIKLLPLESEEKREIKMELEPDQQVLIPTTALSVMPNQSPPPPLRFITPPAQPSSPVEVNPTPVVSSALLDRTRTLPSLGDDEFMFFGLSVAAQLRSMPLSNAMIMQSKIQYMLSVERRKISGDTTEVNLFT
ncbi:hypothetical protein AWZ03_012890 [Drosophila navojoa]|uniref:MADF domain-containing protein n=1 Tax=Drosophila navojoa TaxID=7232 RepID=A0A484AWA7_DRONA|nr:uncharacterized protein LOC115564634 [Drosophila navojoa]TDG40684.1 hypothetical protein AWZ03_012890 [Drosophila navojoa]